MVFFRKIDEIIVEVRIVHLENKVVCALVGCGRGRGDGGEVEGEREGEKGRVEGGECGGGGAE